MQHLAAACIVCAAAEAQNDVFNEVALRVSSLRPGGACVVDRGKRDLVQVGDHVVLVPRNGQTIQGRVTELDDRTAVVELQDPTAVVPIGTRGHVLVPKTRQQPAAPPTPTPSVPAEPSQPPADEWKPGMPLLGNTRPPRPAERTASMHGRVYGAANLVHSVGSWRESYLDTGVDMEIDNVEGKGGTLRMHGAFNWSTEVSENTGTDLRLFEFSYARGGNRFEPTRVQVGRFLHNDMPEFGLLDGIEVGYRREGGDRIGASFGYLPELDDDMESFADLEVAAWYVWNQDVVERVSVALGYQHSWHRFDPDRDLFVVRARYLPLDGWDVTAAVWIDAYTASDVTNKSLDFTRGNVFLTRRVAKVGGIEAFVEHEAYPLVQRRELPQTIQPQTLLDAHEDRASVHAFTNSNDTTEWFTRVTGWIDQKREGGALELGVRCEGLIAAHARTTLAGYASQGLSSSVFGARIEHGANLAWGRLDLLYELGFVHYEGFPASRDDLLQHRLAALATTTLGSWDASFFADGTFWDQELSLGIGIYVQRIF